MVYIKLVNITLGGEILVKLVKSLIITFFMIFLVGCTAAWGAEDQYYLKLSSLSTDVSGDFDGMGGYGSKDNISGCLIPKFETSDGFALSIGGYRERLGGEISYYRTSGRASNFTNALGTSQGDSIYEKINLDIRVYAFKFEQKKFNLYGLVGYGYGRIKADNMFLEFNGVTGTLEETGEAEFKGQSFNLGAGVIFRIGSRLMLDGSYIYSRMYVNRMNGLGNAFKPEDTFIGDNKTINLSICYLF